MKIIRAIYAVYVLLIFTFTFLIIYPFALLFIYVPGLFFLTSYLLKIWTVIFFVPAFIPLRIQKHPQVSKSQPCVYCANHFSYMDIPVLGLSPGWYLFVGKNSIGKVPLFGHLYRNLNILVDRSDRSSRWESVTRSIEAIKRGQSPIFFPEGGIRAENPPEMAPFKDGAFKVAIKTQVPVVPVTLPYNYQLLKENELNMRWRPLKVIYHEPIPTVGMTEKDIDILKEKTRAVIQQKLNEMNKSQ